MHKIQVLLIALTGCCFLLNACTKPLHTNTNDTNQVATSVRDSTAYTLRGDSLLPPLIYKAEELGDFGSPLPKSPSRNNSYPPGNIRSLSGVYSFEILSFEQLKDQKYLRFLDGEMVEGKKKEKLLKKLKREDIDTIRIMSADEAVELYGQKAAHGAVIIETKKDK